MIYFNRPKLRVDGRLIILDGVEKDDAGSSDSNLTQDSSPRLKELS
jgi:hypothetical protein